MDKHRILIVEDNFVFAVKLEKNIVDWGHQIVGICETGECVLDFLKTETPTLILMDINLKGSMNGVKTANEIKDKGIPIVFITGQADEKTYEDVKGTSVISYLVKPFDLLTLRGTLDFNPYLNLESQDEDFLFIKRNRELVKVKTTDISYIKSDRNYCDIFVGERVYFVKTSLTKLMEKLQVKSLVQIQRGYVVNLKSIEGLLLSENMVKIGGQSLPIGRKYKKEFLERIEDYRL